MSQKFFTIGGSASCSKVRILDGIWRMTAETPWRSRKTFTRKRAEPGSA